MHFFPICRDHSYGFILLWQGMSQKEIGTTARYHFVSIRMANIKTKNKKIENDVSARMWKNWHPARCWWECKIAQLLCKTVRRVLKELETELQYDPAIPLKDIYSKGLKAGTGTDMSINGGVDKQNIIQP